MTVSGVKSHHKHDSGRAASKCLSASAGETAGSGSPAEAARRRLRSSTHREVQVLTCEHHEGALILRGQVTSWHQKQVAQETIRHLPDVGMIVNCVEVVPRRPSALRHNHDGDGTT